jgi:hypothetical protein
VRSEFFDAAAAGPDEGAYRMPHAPIPAAHVGRETQHINAIRCGGHPKEDCPSLSSAAGSGSEWGLFRSFGDLPEIFRRSFGDSVDDPDKSLIGRGLCSLDDIVFACSAYRA